MKNIAIAFMMIFSTYASEIYDAETIFVPKNNLVDQKLYEIYKRNKPEKVVLRCSKKSLNFSEIVSSFMSIIGGIGQVVGATSSFDSRGGFSSSSGSVCETIQLRMNFREFKDSIDVNIGSLKLDQQYSQNQFKDLALILMESQKSSYIDDLKIQFNKLVSIYEEYYSCQALGKISIIENKQIKQAQKELVNFLRDETQRLEILASQKQGISIVELRDSLRNIHVPYYDLDDEKVDRFFKYNLSQNIKVAVELQEACRANNQDAREALITSAVDKVLAKSNLGNLKYTVNKQVYVHNSYQNVLRKIINKSCL